MAAITNGAVRDIPEVTDAGLHLFAGNLSPSHAYVHVVEHGRPVKLAGLTVTPGELLHLDQHGVVSVPQEIADELPAAAQRLRDREAQIVDYCLSAAFSAEGLRKLIATLG